ncbi:MAG TPA: tetratricopeptide repeat protein [Rhizomicrobium sp.]|nr:tetratricopeptide repeat protein [Rhizomicrobium sp.]
MPTLDTLLDWVKNHEQLLSGLAALVVLVGVIVSPLGHGARMILARRRGSDAKHAASVGGTAHPAIVMDRPSVAVLPFDNLSDDRALEFAADGMCEDIITELSRDRRLFVVARNSSFAYKGTNPDVRQVGRELGVHFVLEGSVRRTGDNLRVNAQLIDARSGAHIWAEALNRDFADAVKMQDEIGHSIAMSLTSHFFRDVSHEAAQAAPESLQAWELGARAAIKWASGQDDTSDSSALRYLTLALEKYPDSAEIWAQLGAGIAFGWLYDSSIDFSEASEYARSCIDKALSLAPNDPSIVGAQGASLSWLGEPKRALPILRRAAAQIPNEAPLRINLAYALQHAGSPAEALAELDQLERLSLHDMMRSVYDLARADIELDLGHFAQAEIGARKAIVGSGQNVWAWVTLAIALAAQDRIAEAREAMGDALKHMASFTLEFYERSVRILYEGNEALIADRLRLMAMAWPGEP